MLRAAHRSVSNGLFSARRPQSSLLRIRVTTTRVQYKDDLFIGTSFVTRQSKLYSKLRQVPLKQVPSPAAVVPEASSKFIVREVLYAAGVLTCWSAVGFGLSVHFKNQDLIPVFAASGVLVNVWTACLRSRKVSNRAAVLASLLTLSTIRLGTHLGYKALGVGEEDRFSSLFPKEGEGWYDKDGADFPLELASYWFAQVAATVVACLPVTTLVLSSRVVKIGRASKAAIALFVAGLAYEFVADMQKFTFKYHSPRGEKWVDTGLWSVSRYPNYLGNIVQWWALYFAALPALKGHQRLTLVSPLFMTFLITNVTGIPVLERKHEEKYGSDPAYQEYVAKTPALIPRGKDVIDYLLSQ